MLYIYKPNNIYLNDIKDYNIIKLLNKMRLNFNLRTLSSKIYLDENQMVFYLAW